MELYPIALFVHSWMRHIVVISLVCTVLRALYGRLTGAQYTGMDRLLCRITVAASHLQIVLGFTVYMMSPMAAYFRSHFRDALAVPEALFFGVLHGLIMLGAVIVLTIGGSLSRRSSASDAERFRLVSVYFGIAFLLILLAIPWPFSPLAARPWVRPL